MDKTRSSASAPYSCPKCGGSNKYRSSCKDCQRDYLRAYRQRNRERVSEYNANARVRHRDKRRAYARLYRQTHKGSINTKQRNAYHKDYRAKNKERLKKQQREWYAANKWHALEKRDQSRAMKYNAPVVEWIDREKIIERDGLICYLCRSTLTLDEVVLDHVIPLRGGGNHTAENLRVACDPCNAKKGAKIFSADDLKNWVAPKSPARFRRGRAIRKASNQGYEQKLGFQKGE